MNGQKIFLMKQWHNTTNPPNFSKTNSSKHEKKKENLIPWPQTASIQWQAVQPEASFKIKPRSYEAKRIMEAYDVKQDNWTHESGGRSIKVHYKQGLKCHSRRWIWPNMHLMFLHKQYDKMQIHGAKKKKKSTQYTDNAPHVSTI